MIIKPPFKFKHNKESISIGLKHITLSNYPYKIWEDIYQKISMLEYSLIKDYIDSPNRILDIGCGLGRMSIYINSQLENQPEFILLDGSREDTIEYGFSEQNKKIFYNNLQVTEIFCRLNGLNNFKLFDINQNNLNTLKDIDLVMSFYSAGFHYPLEEYVNDLSNITTKDCVYLFGTRHGIYTKKSFSDKFKYVDIIDNSMFNLEDFFNNEGEDNIKILTRYYSKFIITSPFPNDYILSRMKTKNKYFEEATLQYIYSMNLRGTYVDCGAYIGTHTLYFSKVCRANSVISFEPQPEVYQYLNNNIINNKLENITTYNIALDNTPGKGHSHINSEVDTLGNYGATKIIRDDNGNVDIRTLDSFDLKDVNLLKIDVEGMELNVLKGSINTIKNNPLKCIITECKNEDIKTNIAKFLKEFGYNLVYEIDENLIWTR